MNIREQLLNDINTRTQIKLAGFAEIKPYLANALLGGATLSAFTALPALLHSYSKDEDPLKVLAEATKYSMPIGAILGAGATGASRLSEALASSAENISNKSLQAIDKLVSGTRDIANDAVNTMASYISPTVEGFKDLTQETATLPLDLTQAISSIIN